MFKQKEVISAVLEKFKQANVLDKKCSVEVIFSQEFQPPPPNQNSSRKLDNLGYYSFAVIKPKCHVCCPQATIENQHKVCC